MTSEQIKKFVETKITQKDKYVKIEFSKRDPIYGIFISDADYQDLSAKNFWRIVTSKHFDHWSPYHWFFLLPVVLRHHQAFLQKQILSSSH